MVQILTLIDMNIPDDYIAFARYFEITQLNFDFFDFLTIQDEMAGDNEAVGERSLTNLNFSNSNLIIEYFYFIIILIIIGISHATFKFIVKGKTFDDDDSYLKIVVDFLKNGFEYKVYINLLLYTSLMTLTISWNQIIGVNFDRALNGIGFFISLIWFLALSASLIIPTLLASLKSKTNKVVNGPVTEEIVPESLSFLDKLKISFNYGLRDTKLSNYYNAIFIGRRALIAFILITFSVPVLQLCLFIVISIAYTAYI